MCAAFRSVSPSGDELKQTMANHSEAELHTILSAQPGEFTTEAIEAARKEWVNRGLVLESGALGASNEAPVSSSPRKSGFFGKWDFIGCAIVSVLALAGNRDPALWTSGSIWGPFLIGQFIGFLALWALIKGGFLFVRNLVRGLAKERTK